LLFLLLLFFVSKKEYFVSEKDLFVYQPPAMRGTPVPHTYVYTQKYTDQEN